MYSQTMSLKLTIERDSITEKPASHVLTALHYNTFTIRKLNIIYIHYIREFISFRRVIMISIGAESINIHL